jgi:hypothetical protein
MAVTFSSIKELPNVGADGNPHVVEHFTRIVEMEDKAEESVEKRVKELFWVMQLRHSFSITCDRMEVWRTQGIHVPTETGKKGMYSRSFKPEGCLWTWCFKHLLNIVYHKANFNDIYKNLDTVSRFLRVANRFSKLKTHTLLILKHDHEPNVTR